MVCTADKGYSDKGSDKDKDKGSSEGDDQAGIGQGGGGGSGGVSTKMRVVFDGAHRQATEMRVSLRAVPKGQGLASLSKGGASTGNHNSHNNSGVTEILLPSHSNNLPSSSASSSAFSFSVQAPAPAPAPSKPTKETTKGSTEDDSIDSSHTWAADHLISADVPSPRPGAFTDGNPTPLPPYPPPHIPSYPSTLHHTYPHPPILHHTYPHPPILHHTYIPPSHQLAHALTSHLTLSLPSPPSHLTSPHPSLFLLLSQNPPPTTPPTTTTTT